MNSSCQILIKLDGLKTERNSYDSQRLEEKFTSSTLKWRKAGHPPADNCYSHPPDAFKLLLISPSSDCLTHRDICSRFPHLLCRAFPVCLFLISLYFLVSLSVYQSGCVVSCCTFKPVTCFLWQCQLSLPGPVNLSCLFFYIKFIINLHQLWLHCLQLCPITVIVLWQILWHTFLILWLDMVNW